MSAAPMNMDQIIGRKLTDALQAEHVHVQDESWRHKGHAGAKEGGHYVVTVVSAAFEGKGPVDRHRLVYDALGDTMNSLHALQIQALTPAQWAERRPL